MVGIKLGWARRYLDGVVDHIVDTLDARTPQAARDAVDRYVSARLAEPRKQTAEWFAVLISRGWDPAESIARHGTYDGVREAFRRLLEEAVGDRLLSR